MKHRYPFLAVVFMSLVFFSSCTIDKRLYVSGYNVDWKRPAKAESLIDVKPNVSVQFIASNVYLQKSEPLLTASIKEPGVVFQKSISLIKRDSIQPKAEECDVIIFKDGEEIKGKVSEITPTAIRYKKCDHLTGPDYLISKSDVFMVKYSNGTKEVMKAEATVVASNTGSNNSPKGKPKIYALSIIGLAAGLLGLLIMGIPLGIAAVLLGGTSISSITKHPDLFKGIGLAIAAIAIGAFDIIAVLFILSTL